MRTWDRTARAWAAGLFEGEGTAIFWEGSGPGGSTIRAAVKMTDEAPVRAFGEIVGFGTIRGPIRPVPGPPHWKSFWLWQTGSFQYVQQLAALLWPWLYERRRQQFRGALAAYRAVSRRDGAGTVAMRLFGKRFRDLNAEELRRYTNERHRLAEWRRRGVVLDPWAPAPTARSRGSASGS